MNNAGFIRVWRQLLRDSATGVGFVLLAIVILLALTADLLFPGDPARIVGPAFLWPGDNPAFPLGTDSLGRDVLAGIAHGARVSLTIGLLAAAIGAGIAGFVGATAGYLGGWYDNVMMRITELFQTVPTFLFIIVILVIAQPSTQMAAVAIGITAWPAAARQVRAEFRSLREIDFVLAARSLGFSHARIIFCEILPNSLPPLIVNASVMVATAIKTETALSFLGVSDPNLITWGGMIGAGQEFLRTEWYLSAIPGLAIAFAVLGVNLVGDGLNDALNPRLRERGT